MQGKIIIISAPSGAGKTTIVKHITESIASLGFSVSATSRKPREGEIHGVDYYFMTPDEFKREISNNSFIEYEEVYNNHFYGTLKEEVQRIWEDGRHIIFDVDVIGGIKLKRIYGDLAYSVFIMPPSVEALENRLRFRGTDSEEKIVMRIEKAVEEIGFAVQFDIVIVNDELETAKGDALSAIETFLNMQ